MTPLKVAAASVRECLRIAFAGCGSFCLLTPAFLFSRIIDNMETPTHFLNVKIKRIDTSLPLPAYATAGSVGFDLVCREDTEVAPQSLALVPSNLIVQTPPGYMLLLTMRSSTAKRKGLLMPNGVGIIDQDYCGEGDELMISVYNFRTDPTMVLRGERIAQGIFVPVMRAEWREVEYVGSGRGGFGSTGT